MFFLLFQKVHGFKLSKICRENIKLKSHFQDTTNDMHYMIDLMNNNTEHMYKSKMSHFEETTNDMHYMIDLMNNNTEHMYKSKMSHFEETTNDMLYLHDLINNNTEHT